MAERLIVIGADAGGMSAASQARRQRGPDDLEIVAFERGHFTSYSACGIPYWIGGSVRDRDALIVRDPAAFREHGIDVRLQHEVVAIDLDRREVLARDLSDGGREVREGFDQLVYAAGAVPTRPDWAEANVDGLFGVQTLDDGAALRAWLDGDGRPRRAVVVGGGYIGVEMAEAMMERGLSVTLIERDAEPMPALDPDMGALISRAMRAMGIDVRTGVLVTGLHTADGRVTGVETDVGPVPADVVVLGLGVRPNTALAAQAGLPLGPTGGIRTDLRMRVVGAAGVWAAGDCVECTNRVSGHPVYMPLGTHANKQGRVAGINIGGGYATFPGVIGTAVTKVCGLEVGTTGLGERKAVAAGFTYETSCATSTNRAGYLDSADPLTVKLVAERRTGRLLGAQIVGGADAAKRIDVLAVAVWSGMSMEEISGLDLGYAPPFGPVWDAALLAARHAVPTTA